MRTGAMSIIYKQSRVSTQLCWWQWPWSNLFFFFCRTRLFTLYIALESEIGSKIESVSTLQPQAATPGTSLCTLPHEIILQASWSDLEIDNFSCQAENRALPSHVALKALRALRPLLKQTKKIYLFFPWGVSSFCHILKHHVISSRCQYTREGSHFKIWYPFKKLHKLLVNDFMWYLCC